MPRASSCASTWPHTLLVASSSLIVPLWRLLPSARAATWCGRVSLRLVLGDEVESAEARAYPLRLQLAHMLLRSTNPYTPQLGEVPGIASGFKRPNKAKLDTCVVARTGLGGMRVIDMMVGEQLPRIC